LTLKLQPGPVTSIKLCVWRLAGQLTTEQAKRKPKFRCPKKRHLAGDEKSQVSGSLYIRCTHSEITDTVLDA
jgi:hypothetical protein